MSKPLGEQDFNDNLQAEIEAINASLLKIGNMMKTQKQGQNTHLKPSKKG